MASAIDQQGYLWIFGGETKDLGFHTGWNDLWKFNTATKNWTWMGGSTSHSSSGSYNLVGTPDWPRARYRARGWFDKAGNYWVFGGLYYDGINPPYPLNDMWKYNGTTAIWTCETGDCNQLLPPNTPSGNYPSTVGQTSTAYKPRGRGDYGYWIDRDENFWLYGGYNGEVHAGGISMWDTWKYNTKNRDWTLLTLEDAPSAVSPGWQSEPLCWLGNDGLPWMKLVNRSIWKFKNGHWENQRFEAPNTWEPAILLNNQPFVSNSTNQPGSQFTTFNHIKTDSAVYLFNGYGLGTSNFPSYTGGLWRFSLEIVPDPKLEMAISKDDFVPSGASPYGTSKREVTLKNTGYGIAYNVKLSLGLGLENSLSAMQVSNLKVLDEANTPVPFDITSVSFKDPNNVMTCGFDSVIYKSGFVLHIPKIAIGETLKISALVNHCMASQDLSTNQHYTWNYWGAKATFQDLHGKEYLIPQINSDLSKTLDSYRWKAYKVAIPTLENTAGSKLFNIELGSGAMGSPTNSQDLGESFSKAQARLDLTLPQNINLATGSLSDISGEYAVQTGGTIQLFTVNASIIQMDLTKPLNAQPFIVKFPNSRYLPIRRIFVKLRANSGTENTSGIKAEIRTTFNSSFANMNYGWRTASQ